MGAGVRLRAMIRAEFHSELAMAVLDLTRDNFDDVVTSNEMVIVDFWAPWCGRAPGLGAVKRPSAGMAPCRPAIDFAWSV